MHPQVLFTMPILARELVIVENIRPVRLLDLTADFGVKTNGKVDADYQSRKPRMDR